MRHGAGPVHSRWEGAMDDAHVKSATVQIGQELLESAERVGLDVPRVIERALRDEVRRKVTSMDPREREALREQIRAEIRAEVEWYNDYSEKHGLFADHWRTF